MAFDYFGMYPESVTQGLSDTEREMLRKRMEMSVLAGMMQAPRGQRSRGVGSGIAAGMSSMDDMMQMMMRNKLQQQRMDMMERDFGMRQKRYDFDVKRTEDASRLAQQRETREGQRHKYEMDEVKRQQERRDARNKLIDAQFDHLKDNYGEPMARLMIEQAKGTGNLKNIVGMAAPQGKGYDIQIDPKTNTKVFIQKDAYGNVTDVRPLSSNPMDMLFGVPGFGMGGPGGGLPGMGGPGGIMPPLTPPPAPAEDDDETTRAEKARMQLMWENQQKESQRIMERNQQAAKEKSTMQHLKEFQYPAKKMYDELMLLLEAQRGGQ